MQLTDTEKSQAFAKIIKTKVLAAYALAIDDLIVGSKFPLEIEPRNYPANVVDADHFDGKALIEKNTRNGKDRSRNFLLDLRLGQCQQPCCVS